MAEPSVCERCGRPRNIWGKWQNVGCARDSDRESRARCNELHIARLETTIAATKAAVERAKAAEQERCNDDCHEVLMRLIAQLESIK